MGEVYRARDTRLGRDVAIKLLPAEVASDAERLARFRREAHLPASLNHSHIAAVYGLEELVGKLLLVLELVEGEDLAQRLKRGAIPVDEALAVARQIGSAGGSPREGHRAPRPQARKHQADAGGQGEGTRLPAEGRLDEDDLRRALGPRTKLLAIEAASNAIGTINDIRRAGDFARAQGALVFVDAVHYAPHVFVDVAELRCDFLACSAYKFYGPHVGVLYGRRDLLAGLPVPKLQPAPDEVPDRLETGTLNHEGIAGTAAAVDFLASLGAGASRRERLRSALGLLHARGEELVARMWNGLAAIRGVTLHGRPPGAPRTPTVAFTVAGISSTAVAVALAERGVFVSNGDFYALTAIDRLGHAKDGVVRAGCACYTTVEEVDRLIEGVRALVEGLNGPCNQAKELPAPGQQPARYHVAWDNLMRDLSALRAIRVQLDGELYRLRTELRGNANDGFQTVGLRPPPLAQKLGV